MSSVETVLQNERSKRPGEFIFTWSIHNYSYCTTDEDDSVWSPKFVVEMFHEDKWWLSLFPISKETPGFVNCYLGRQNDTVATCNFTLSYRTADGRFTEGSEIISNRFLLYSGYSNFISSEDLKGPNGCLVNDSLTIRCRMWKTDGDIPISAKCDVHSKFQVSKLNYTWLLKDIAVSNQASECEFYHSSNITDLVTNIKSREMKLHIYLINKRSLSESDIYFGIKLELLKPRKKARNDDEATFFSKCQIHFLDANGKVVHSASSQQIFLECHRMKDCKFPVISKHKFYLNKNEYAPRGKLTLQCEFSYATNNELETIECRTTNDIEVHYLSMTEPEKELEFWIKNMQQQYAKFTNFSIRTSGRQFSVNRTILGAHSKVFKAMFERDMKERNSGVVVIEDFDDDTVDKMLKYVYTSTIDNIDCTGAQNLYLAAYKYGITALQKKCSKYLIACIDSLNVCDILELADTHQDLKSCARNFVFVHSQSVMNSERWKKLLEDIPALTSEIMQWMICNKFLI